MGSSGIASGRPSSTGDRKAEASLAWRFHGPGECVESRGEGKGVTSPIAAMTGLATVELAAEAEPKAPDRLPALKLGVLVIERREEAEGMCLKESFGEGFGFLAGAVKPWWEFECGGEPGRSSVCSRRALLPRWAGRWEEKL